MSALSFLIVLPAGEFATALESSAGAEICGRVDVIGDIVETVKTNRPDALLVSLHNDPEAILATLEKLLEPKPLLFFHGPDNSRLILRAMRLGAREYIAPGPEEKIQLLTSLARVAQEIDGPRPEKLAPLIAVIGAKGGVGTSFVACQLGASLARSGARTALVDGNLRHGDVALYLDLSPAYTFSSLAVREEPVDFTYLKTTLAEHASGVEVLAAPKNPEEADVVGVDCVEGVIHLLRPEFDWVIWDTSREFDDRSLYVLDQASLVLLVTTPDVPAMNHTRMQLEVLQRLGHAAGKIKVVGNRTEYGTSVSAREAKEFLDRPIDASVPNDYRRASACLNEGRTIHDVAPRSPLGRGVGELATLAHTWCDRPAPTRKPRLFDRMRGR